MLFGASRFYHSYQRQTASSYLRTNHHRQCRIFGASTTLIGPPKFTHFCHHIAICHMSHILEHIVVVHILSRFQNWYQKYTYTSGSHTFAKYESAAVPSCAERHAPLDETKIMIAWAPMICSTYVWNFA